MNQLTAEEKNKIIELFKSRGVKNLCPMCGNNNFIIADAYLNNTLQDNFKNISIGGPSIPTIPIFCSNCGFTSQHALGILGLLSEFDNAINENEK